LRAAGLAVAASCFFLAPLSGAQESIVFTGYNVENYLTTDRRGPDGKRAVIEKPEKEKEALIRIIAEIKPDILGVCEMGTLEDFADFKRRLAEAGLDYPESEYLQAADEDRHLALLSKFPITSRQSLADASFDLNGVQEKVRRGFLDVTVKVKKDYDLRIVERI